MARLAALLAAFCLVALASLGVAGPARAQAPSPPPDTGFEEVEVDLEGQMFSEVLPFDVPFVIHGKLPAGIHQLQVRCWVVRETKVAGGRALQEPAFDARPDGDCPGWEGKPLTWRNTIDPNATDPTFRLLLPRLEAERYYQFRFSYDKQITAEEAQAFASRLQQTVSGVLWGSPRQTAALPLSGDLTDDDVRVLRARLVAGLKAVTGADRFPDCGSSQVFCEGASFAAVRNELNEDLRPVREAQGRITAAIRDYQDEVSNLTALLVKIRGDESLLRLKAGLDALAAANAGFQPQAKTVGDVLVLPDPPQLLERHRESPAALGDFLGAAAQALAAAAQDLGALASFLGERLVDGGGAPQPLAEQLLSASALSRDDLDGLRALAQPNGALGAALRAANRIAGNIVPVRLQRFLSDRSQAVTQVAALYRTRVQGMAMIAGSTTGNFATQHRNYVSADTGVAYAPELDEFPTYVGTNIYFRPVNKAAALSQLGNFWQTLDRRASVTLGLTVNGVADDRTRDDLFGSQSLILGIGVRMTNSVRLTAGSLVFLEKDPNPLVDDDEVAVTPFVSISFDVDVAPTLQGIGGLFKPGQ